MPRYFALTEETLKEVLTHLEKDATALLYSKVQKALPVQESNPEPVNQNDPVTNTNQSSAV